MANIVKVLQLTDAHLQIGLDDELMGANVDQLFRRVLAHAQNHEPTPDVLLMTGDLAQDATIPVYHRLRDYLAEFTGPQRWVPGNHDELDVMRQAVPQYMEPVLDVGDWRIVSLSTLQPGKVGGYLAKDELATLIAALDGAEGRFVLVVLHHPLVEIGAAWLDEQKVSNGAEVLALLRRYPGVKATLGGHIHQELDVEIHGIRLLSSPSTWVQFAPRSDDFALDEIAPGYRWLELQRNGTINTRVVRVGGPAQNVNYKRGRGY